MSLRSDGPRRSPLLQKLESAKEPRREGTQKATKNEPTRAALRADSFQPPARKPVELSPSAAPRAAVATALATPTSRTVAAAAVAPEAATPPSRGAEAANRVNDAYTKAPEGERARAAAEALQREAEALKDDPEALAELYEGSRETVQKVAEELGRRVVENDDGQTEETVRALAFAADHLGAEATQQIGQALAKAVPDDGDLNELDDALWHLAEDGLGLNLSTAVVSELGKLGKSEAANELTDVLVESISTARGEFQDAQNRVDTLNEELAYMVQSYGGLLNEEQRQAAVNDFKTRHADAYAALEREAAEFTQVLGSVAQLSDGSGAVAGLSEDNRAEVLEEANKALVNVFPRLGDTEAGAMALAQALEAQGRGEPTFLDQVTELTQNLTDEQVKDLASDETEAAGFGDLVSFQQGVAETMFTAATLHISLHPERAQRTLDGLKQNAALFGVDAAKLQTLADDVTALASATDAAEIDRLKKKISEQSGDLEFLSPSTRAGQAFGAFTTVLGVIGAAGSLENWDELELQDKIGAIGGALDTGIGAYQTIMGVAGRASSISTVAGRASGVLGGLGVVLDGLSAVDAFRNGDYVSGAGYSASAVGGAILTAAAFSNAVPGAGQIAAGVLIAVGFGLNQWAHVRESNKHEGPAQDFLEGAGLSSKLAEELSNHTGNGFPAGPALVEVAKLLNIPPDQLLAHLETKSEGELQSLIEGAVHRVEMEGEGEERGFPPTGDDAEAIRKWPEDTQWGLPRPDSIEGLAVWMQRQGFLPEGVQVPA
jgi:hypothetical protein